MHRIAKWKSNGFVLRVHKGTEVHFFLVLFYVQQRTQQKKWMQNEQISFFFLSHIIIFMLNIFLFYFSILMFLSITVFCSLARLFFSMSLSCWYYIRLRFLLLFFRGVLVLSSNVCGWVQFNFCDLDVRT